MKSANLFLVNDKYMHKSNLKWMYLGVKFSPQDLGHISLNDQRKKPECVDCSTIL